MLYRTRQKLVGFTLVEVLVVVVIIALLAVISAVVWRGVDNRAFNTRELNALTSYRDAFSLYASQQKQYPPVPREGNYCLQFGGLTGSEVNSRWPSLARPATITAQGVTETSYWCKDFAEPSYYASYPPLSKALAGISTVTKQGSNSDYLADRSSGGTWAQYSGTADYTGLVSAATIKIYGYFSGSSTSCPNGTTYEWSNSDKVICYLTLDRQYPTRYTSYTGEVWTWNTY